MDSMRGVWRVATALLSILVAAGATELALRAGGYHYSPLQIGAGIKDDWRDDHAFGDRNLIYDPVLIWRPRSGQFSPFNPQGFRGPLVDTPKPPGIVRIFALGDSNTFGWDVDEGVNWPSQLQRLLASSPRRTEVINAGVWGYSSFQGLRRFRELLEFEPDLVLVSFGANDAHQVTVADADYVARHERAESLTRASRKLRVAQLAIEGWDKLSITAGRGSGGPLRPRVTTDDYAAHLREMIQSGRGRGVRVVLLTRPFVGSSTDPASWKTYAPHYNAATMAVAREQNVPVVDVHGAFRDRPELFDDESHFGAEGHGIAAALIFERLKPLLAG
jgi:lysophospholipase L1-like esterase